MVDFFCSVGLDVELKNELIHRRVSSQIVILWHANGTLQKELNVSYKDLPFFLNQ